MKTELEERLKQEAQIQAQEARSHRATVREIYQAVTGRTGEAGDWNGAKPVLALIEERDTLSAQVREIPDLLTIAHMQGAEQAKDQIQALRAQIAALDCRLVGRVGELSGSHCPSDAPCDRCVAEWRIAELEAGLMRLATWGETHGITDHSMEAVARAILNRK